MNRSLEGKRALVTGAGSGIGRAIAVAFAAEGARVAGADIDADGLAGTAEAVRPAGGDFIEIACDVSDEGDICDALREVEARLGGLDILVSNAGTLIEKPLVETSAADFDWLIGVNLRGLFLAGREAARVMLRQDGGRIINVASELAYLGRENVSLYCASKGAVLSLTRSWARELAPTILVNTLAPGPTATPMLFGGSTSAETLKKETQNPLGRLGQPEEIAAAAVFLAGPGASFMTGQCLSPNGGAAMF